MGRSQCGCRRGVAQLPAHSPMTCFYIAHIATAAAYHGDEIDSRARGRDSRSQIEPPNWNTPLAFTRQRSSARVAVIRGREQK